MGSIVEMTYCFEKLPRVWKEVSEFTLRGNFPVQEIVCLCIIKGRFCWKCLWKNQNQKIKAWNKLRNKEGQGVKRTPSHMCGYSIYFPIFNNKSSPLLHIYCRCLCSCSIKSKSHSSWFLHLRVCKPWQGKINKWVHKWTIEDVTLMFSSSQKYNSWLWPCRVL